MKGLSTLITFQALLATISSIYISKISFIGRVGISFFYKDYQILKVWWKTALIFFCVQLLVILILWIAKKIFRKTHISFIPGFLFLIVAATGAYFTYLDFTTTSHKYMRTNFHTGVYLFWAGWVISCLYFMLVNMKPKLVKRSPSENPHENNI